jgi:hypothetical protein
MINSNYLAPFQRLGIVLGAATLFCGSFAFWQAVAH